MLYGYGHKTSQYTLYFLTSIQFFSRPFLLLKYFPFLEVYFHLSKPSLVHFPSCLLHEASLIFLSSIFKALFDTFPVILITLKYAFHIPGSPLLLNWKFLEPGSCHSSLHWPENSAHTWYPGSDKRKNEYIFPRERALREKCKGSRAYALIGGAEKRSQRKRQRRSACGKSR